MADVTSRSDLETDTRVSVLESQFENITNNVSKLEQKIDSNYATLHHRISDMRDDLRDDIDSKHERIMEKLDERSKSSSEQHEEIFSKIADLEKWRWMMVGGAIVVGYILAHIKIDKLF